MFTLQRLAYIITIGPTPVSPMVPVQKNEDPISSRLYVSSQEEKTTYVRVSDCSAGHEKGGGFMRAVLFAVVLFVQFGWLCPQQLVVLDDFNYPAGYPVHQVSGSPWRQGAAGHLNSLGWMTAGPGHIETLSGFGNGEVIYNESEGFNPSYPGFTRTYIFGGMCFVDQDPGGYDHGGVGFLWRENYTYGMDSMFFYSAPGGRELVIQFCAGVTRPGSEHTLQHTYFIKSSPCMANFLSSPFDAWRDMKLEVRTDVYYNVYLQFSTGVYPNFAPVVWDINGTKTIEVSLTTLLMNAKRRSNSDSPCLANYTQYTAWNDGLRPSSTWYPMYVMAGDFLLAQWFAKLQ
jgi:hypothetical protein